MWKRIAPLMLSLFVLSPTVAQENALLSLIAETTTFQTGQRYPVTIQIENVSELWLADLEISYDPSKIYIFGTQSGSPVTPGDVFPSDLRFLARNRITGDGRLIYTVSLLAPADPISGDGALGSFDIYPLMPGTTQLLFSRGGLARAIYTQQGDQRIATGSEDILFTPVLLELTITGDLVDPPLEATATPAPTFTPDPNLALGDVTPEPAEPTLVNVTAAPRPTPIPVSPQQDSDRLLIVALILVIVGGLGILIALLYWHRRYH